MTRSGIGPALGAAVLLAAGGTLASETSAPQQDEGPVLEAITQHQIVLRYQVIYPEFHFHDASGNVHFFHRELVTTNAPKLSFDPDGVVSISAEQQKKGAVLVGQWNCGPETYFVTLRAFLIDLDGRHSNSLEYTIHCNGG